MVPEISPGWRSTRSKTSCSVRKGLLLKYIRKGDRLVDTCDVYHLWVFDKKFTMPFGIHPKEYQHAVNRGYSISEGELEEIQQYHQVSRNTENGG